MNASGLRGDSRLPSWRASLLVRCVRAAVAVMAAVILDFGFWILDWTAASSAVSAGAVVQIENQESKIENGPPAPPAAPVGQAIRLQRNVRRQYQELIQAMHQVAADLEKTDPETAASIAAAAQKAEAAFIADDMEKVIQLLQGGLIIPADATQARIIRHLRAVLETLRGTGEDLEARIQLLRRTQELVAALRDLARRQRALERQSRVLAFGDELKKKIEAAQGRIRQVARQQRVILTQTEALSFNPAVHHLAASRRAFEELLRRAEAVAALAANPYPSPDEMAALLASNQTLRGEIVEARVAFRTVVNTPALLPHTAPAKAESDAACAALGRAAEELAKAAASLEKDDLKGGLVGDAEARREMRAAVAALDQMMAAVGASPAAAATVAAQEKLAQEAATLPPLTEILPLMDGGPGAGSAAASPPAAGHAPAPDQAPHLAAMGAAAAALRLYDREAALAGQRAVIRALDQTAALMDQECDNMDRLRDDPRYPEQAKAQDGIRADLADLIKGEKPADEPAPPGRSPAGPSPLTGDLMIRVTEAMEHAGAAATFLGRPDPAQANREQNEAIRLLEHVAEELELQMESAMPFLTEELKGLATAILERLVAIQKSCLADTIETWAKRGPDGTFQRAEQVRFLAIAKLEGEITKGLDEMRKLAAEFEAADALPRIPPIHDFVLGLVREDVPVVVERLSRYDGGPGTQRVEQDILERLEGLYEAIVSSESAMQPPHTPSEHVWASKYTLKIERSDVIQMLLVLQQQINRRTRELHEQAASGQATPASARARLAELARQQAEIRRGIWDMIAEDLPLENPWNP